jgi:hypothetical protein
MVTSKLPFEHDDTLELLMLHMTAETPDPRDFRPDVSPALAKVIMKALAKEPGDRYPTGRALADALETALKEKAVIPVEASTLSIMDRVALEKEILPQIPAAVTPQKVVVQSTPSIPAPAAIPRPTEEPTIDVVKPLPVSEPQPGPMSNTFVRVAGIGALLFLLMLAVIFFSSILKDVIAAVTDGTSQVETAETREALANDGTPPGQETESGDSSSSAATPLPAEPTSPPGEIFMPVVTGEGGQTPVVVLSPSSSPTSILPPTDTPPTTYGGVSRSY